MYTRSYQYTRPRLFVINFYLRTFQINQVHTFEPFVSIDRSNFLTRTHTYTHTHIANQIIHEIHTDRHTHIRAFLWMTSHEQVSLVNNKYYDTNNTCNVYIIIRFPKLFYLLVFFHFLIFFKISIIFFFFDLIWYKKFQFSSYSIHFSCNSQAKISPKSKRPWRESI